MFLKITQRDLNKKNNIITFNTKFTFNKFIDR